jgi:hypothetical protein
MDCHCPDLESFGITLFVCKLMNQVSELQIPSSADLMESSLVDSEQHRNAKRGQWVALVY